MASDKDEYLCLTITIYKKPGLEPQEFVNHMHNVHAVICADLMEAYGIVEYTQTHISPETRAGIREFFPDPAFAPFSDFDAVVQITFRKLEDFVKYRHDKYFEDVIMPDHANFAELGRTSMTVGKKVWFVKDGKAQVHNHLLKEQKDGWE